MNKGFTITCNNCGAKINAITHEGDEITIVTTRKYDSYETEIECKCGNSDKDE